MKELLLMSLNIVLAVLVYVGVVTYVPKVVEKFKRK